MQCELAQGDALVGRHVGIEREGQRGRQRRGIGRQQRRGPHRAAQGRAQRAIRPGAMCHRR
ncbi:hypothetical protein ACFQU2_01490 [Siccirubricoccus deserti]